MFFYPKKKPKLNAQSDSFKEKIFSTQLTLSTFHIVEILTRCKETLTRFPSIKKTQRNLTFRIWKMMNESLERHFNWFSLIFILDTLFHYRAKKLIIFLSNHVASLKNYSALHFYVTVVIYTFAFSSYILLVFLAYTISFKWTDVPAPITLAVHP